MKSAYAIVIVGLLASSAFADKKTDAETAFKAGQALYVKAEYDGAAKQFKAAYDLDPDPVYLFNAAQALRNAKKCAEASEYYKKFLAEAKTPPNEAVVKQYLVEVDECAKAQKPVEPPVVAPPPKEEPKPVIEQPAEGEHRGGGSKRLIGYGLVGVGAGLVGLGFYFTTRVKHWEDEADKICPPGMCPEWDTPKNDRLSDVNSKGRRAVALEFGSWITGAAAIGAGVYLIITGGPKTESSLAITPTSNGAQVSFGF